MECVLYKPSNYDVFDDFLKISDHFPKIPEEFKMLSKGRTNVSEHVPKIAEEDPKMFRLNIDKLWLIDIETCQTLRADWSKMISRVDIIFIDLLPLAIPLQFI